MEGGWWRIVRCCPDPVMRQRSAGIRRQGSPVVSGTGLSLRTQIEYFQIATGPFFNVQTGKSPFAPVILNSIQDLPREGGASGEGSPT
jgi:hypothetical protein